MSDDAWKILLRSALACLDTLAESLPETRHPPWSLGGGTVLMLRYAHRLSRDIDIFLSDPQFLTFLSPRLNDHVADLCDAHDEQSSFLKLRLEHGEIDFITAPILTRPGWDWWTFEGRRISRETPVEIAAKKVFYRTVEFKARDVFDLAFVLEREPLAAEQLNALLLARKEALQARLGLLKTAFPALIREQITALPAGKPMLDRAWEVVARWCERDG